MTTLDGGVVHRNKILINEDIQNNIGAKMPRRWLIRKIIRKQWAKDESFRRQDTSFQGALLQRSVIRTLKLLAGMRQASNSMLESWEVVSGMPKKNALLPRYAARGRSEPGFDRFGRVSGQI